MTPPSPRLRHPKPAIIAKLAPTLLFAILIGGLSACAPGKETAEQKQNICSASTDGLTGSAATNGIVGGRAVGSEDPLAHRVVMLLMVQKNGDAVACTGTPISKDIILTAAHCVKDVTDAKDIRAIFQSNPCESGNFDAVSQAIFASDFVAHKQYSGTARAINDLALIRLQREIPTSYSFTEIYDGKSKLSSDDVILAGYGITQENRDDSTRLRTVTKSYRQDVLSTNLSTSSMNFELDQRDSKGVCEGDSGGPIFVESGGVLKLIAVNSIVMGDEDAKLCHGQSRAMYAPKYLAWIQENSARLK